MASKSVRAWVTALAVTCSANLASAGDLVIISSNTAELEPGTIVAGDTPFEIAKGVSVVLVASDGRTLRLDGPYAGKLDDSSSDDTTGIAASLSKLITERKASENKLAVFRSDTKVRLQFRPDIWGIDVARAGRYCLRPDLPATLWWEAARGGISVSLESRAKDGATARVQWPEGRRHQLWPRELSISSGVTYVARLWAEDPGSELELISMPELPSDAHRAAWMADNGCQIQALRWVDAIGARAE